MAKELNVIGDVYGRLTVVANAGRNHRGALLLECLCTCGVTKVILKESVRSGNTKSCGCIHDEKVTQRNTSHGMSDHPAYQSWLAAGARCRNPNHKNANRYSARGIEFRFPSFESLWEHIGATWFKGASLDRIENDGHYEHGNVRWATQGEQARNTCRSVKLTLNGVTMNQTDWARTLGISNSTLQERIEKWGIKRALSTPKRSYKNGNPRTGKAI